MVGLDSRRLLNEGSISPLSIGSLSSSMAENPPGNIEDRTCLEELFRNNIWQRASGMGSFLPSGIMTKIFPSEIFSRKESTPEIIRSIEVGGSNLPSVYISKNSCGGSAGDGMAGRAGAMLAAGAVGTAVDGASIFMAAIECDKNIMKMRKEMKILIENEIPIGKKSKSYSEK